MIAIERIVREALRGEGIRIDRRVMKRPGTIRLDNGEHVPYSVGITCRIRHGGTSDFSRFTARLSPEKSVITVRVPMRYDREDNGRDLALSIETSEYERLKTDKNGLKSFIRYVIRNAGMICDEHVRNLPDIFDHDDLVALTISFGNGWVYNETYTVEGKRILSAWRRSVDIGGAFDAAP